MGHTGVGGSHRGGWGRSQRGWVGHAGVWWVMLGWDWVGHAGVGLGGASRDGVGWVIHRWGWVGHTEGDGVGHEKY